MRSSNQKGSAAIELAISFSVLWLAFTGVFQFGYSTFLYNGLVGQVANAARYSSRADFDSTDTNRFVTTVKNVAVYGNPEGTGKPLNPMLDAAHVRVSWQADAAGVPRTIQVDVVNLHVNAIFRSFRFDSRPGVTVRYAGKYIS